MNRDPDILVHGPGGLIGSIDRAEWDAQAPRVYLTLQNGQRVLLRSSLLTVRDGVAYVATDVDHAVEAAGDESSDDRVPALAQALPPDHGHPGEWNAETVVPVVQEEFDVSTRTVGGTVRVHKRVKEREAVVDPPLLQETVDVQRVKLDQILPDGERPQVRQEGDTLIVPVLEEVYVVEKRLVLREEIRLTTQRTEAHDPKTLNLKYEEVEIERIPLEPAAPRAGVVDQQ